MALAKWKEYRGNQAAEPKENKVCDKTSAKNTCKKVKQIVSDSEEDDEYENNSEEISGKGVDRN